MMNEIWALEQYEQAKKDTMTLIVPCRTNGFTCLVSDCIGTENRGNKKHYKYNKKLYRLMSTEKETYFCLTGNDSYTYAITLYDRHLYENKKIFDPSNRNQIEEIQEIFGYIKDYRIQQGYTVKNICRMFFVSMDKIVFYSIDKNLELSMKEELDDGCYINPEIWCNPSYPIKENLENTDMVLNFCKNKIMEYEKYNIDLKDRFSYIIFDSKTNISVFESSIQNNKELVMTLIGDDYKKL